MSSPIWRSTHDDPSSAAAVDLGLSTYDDPLLTDLELAIVKRAKPHEANTFYRLRSMPGVGKL